MSEYTEEQVKELVRTATAAIEKSLGGTITRLKKKNEDLEKRYGTIISKSEEGKKEVKDPKRITLINKIIRATAEFAEENGYNDEGIKKYDPKIQRVVDVIDEMLQFTVLPEYNKGEDLPPYLRKSIRNSKNFTSALAEAIMDLPKDAIKSQLKSSLEEEELKFVKMCAIFHGGDGEIMICRNPSGGFDSGDFIRFSEDYCLSPLDVAWNREKRPTVRPATALEIGKFVRSLSNEKFEEFVDIFNIIFIDK